MKIHVKDWETKFHGRADVKNPSWFKFQHNTLTLPEFWEMPGEDFKAWMYILSMCSMVSSGEVEINKEHSTRVCGIKWKSIEAVVEKFQLKQQDADDVTDTVRARYAHVTSTFARVEEKRGEETRSAPRSPTLDLETQIRTWGEIYRDEPWVRTEVLKAQAWLATRPGRKLTQKFMTNWLNKGLSDKPLAAAERPVKKYYNPDTGTYEALANDAG